MTTKLTREKWLNSAAKIMAKTIFKKAEIKVPRDYRISCGWPSSGGRAKRNRTIGQCFPRSMSQDAKAEMFVSPTVENPLDVLAILAHEMIHMVDDCKAGHRQPFGRMARAIGLEGKLTATTAGEDLTIELKGIIKTLGKYPHRKLVFKNRNKQSTRMLKLECQDCGCIARMSQAWLEAATFCPCCGGEEIEK